MSEARSEILRRLGRPREGASTAEDPPAATPWLDRPAFDDPPARFEEALRAAGGEVARVGDLAAAHRAVGEIVAAAGARSVVVEDHPDLHGLLLPDGVEVAVVDGGDPELRQRCERADAGVSVATGAIAETGSVVVPSGRGRSRLATLLPPLHVVVVDAGRLTRDLFTWSAELGAELPANLTLVSGPSKTGDIEQTMAVGVHGPKRFVAVVYG